MAKESSIIGKLTIQKWFESLHEISMKICSISPHDTFCQYSQKHLSVLFQLLLSQQLVCKALTKNNYET